MILKRASHKAVKYAIMNWHYSKSIPVVTLAYAVFNDKNEWCGVICFGTGSVNNIARPFGLQQGQVIELLRVALNGKQESTSKAVSLSLKLLKKECPLVKLIISYADTDQGHIGIIYQATNWYYIKSSIDSNIIVNGKRMHRRSIGSLYGTNSIKKLIEMGFDCERIITKPKHKYIYPVDKKMTELCKSMSKPYPKQAA